MLRVGLSLSRHRLAAVFPYPASLVSNSAPLTYGSRCRVGGLWFSSGERKGREGRTIMCGSKRGRFFHASSNQCIIHSFIHSFVPSIYFWLFSLVETGHSESSQDKERKKERKRDKDRTFLNLLPTARYPPLWLLFIYLAGQNHAKSCAAFFPSFIIPTYGISQTDIKITVPP